MNRYFSLVFGVLCFSLQDIALAQVTFPRPESGIVTEKTDAKRAEVTVWVTGDDGKIILTDQFPRTLEFGTASGQPTVEFRIPPQVFDLVKDQFVDVKDVKQLLKIVESSGEESNLDIEAVFVDASTGEFVLGNIFGTLANRVGLGHEVLIPDLFADTNHDAVLGTGDVLYSLVDLNAYLTAIPSFSLGASFNIQNGAAAGLPGMMFSTTPFTFDANTGFSGSPFSGLALVEGQHGVTGVPEPSSMMLLGIALVGLLGHVWQKRRKEVYGMRKRVRECRVK